MYEVNEKIVTEILLELLSGQQEELSAGQISQLVSIAELCPEDGGPAVYHARSLLPECILPILEICPFTEIEDPIEPPRIFNPNTSQFSANNMLPDEYVNMYPNPCGSEFSITVPKNKFDNFIITDISGKLQSSMPTSLSDNLINIKHALLPGVYFVYISTSDGIIHIKKWSSSVCKNTFIITCADRS